MNERATVSLSLLRSRLTCKETGDHVEWIRTLAVGRDPRSDLVLRLPQISGLHAAVQWRDGAWCVGDLRSRNGTTLNGRRIHDWKPLSVGDVLRFGGTQSWVVDVLVEPGEVEAATAFVEDLASHRCVPVCADRFLVGTGAPCELRIPEWLDTPGPAIRLILYEESAELYLAATEGVPGMELDGAPFPSEAVALDRVREVTFGDQRYDLFPAHVTDFVPPTASAMRRTKTYDLQLDLRFTGPGEGEIEVTHSGGTTVIHGAQRFVMMYLLARAGGEWVDDDDLRSGLWGKVGAITRDPTALRKMIYDTRQAFTAVGLDGWFIEKARGKTRIRLESDQIRISEDGAG